MLLQACLLLFPRVILAQEDVCPPVGGVKAPVASPVFQRFVTVHHELMCRVHESAVHALDAGCVGAGVQLRDEETLALSETLVVYFEASLRDLQLQGARKLFLAVRRVGAPVNQGIAQALRVSFGYESAGRRGEWKNPHDFEDLQLFCRAPGAVDVEVVAHRVDLLEGEIPKDGVKDLRQAQTFLAADHETGDSLRLQDRLAPLSGAVGRDEERPRHHCRRLHGQMQHGLGLFPILLEQEVMWPSSRKSCRSAEGAHRAQMKLLESLLQSWVRLEALSSYSLHVFTTTLKARVPFNWGKLKQSKDTIGPGSL